MFNFDFEQQELNEKELKQIILNEVTSFTLEKSIRAVDPQQIADLELKSERAILEEKRLQRLQQRQLDEQQKQLKLQQEQEELQAQEQQQQQQQHRRRLEKQQRRPETSYESSRRRHSEHMQDEEKQHDYERLHKKSRSTERPSRAMSARSGSRSEKMRSEATVARPRSAIQSTRHNQRMEVAESDAMEEDEEEYRSYASPEEKMREYNAPCTRSKGRLSGGPIPVPSRSRRNSMNSSSSSGSNGRTLYHRSTERENESLANITDEAETQTQLKKKRSFTSRLLGTSTNILAKTRSSKAPEKLPNVHRPSSSNKNNNDDAMHVNTSGKRNSAYRGGMDASPMSCSSSSPMSTGYHEEHKHEPVSSMLPIKNILRKSKRHSDLSVSKHSKPSRHVTVPQPFSFSHPRNKLMQQDSHVSARTSRYSERKS